MKHLIAEVGLIVRVFQNGDPIYKKQDGAGTPVFREQERAQSLRASPAARFVLGVFTIGLVLVAGVVAVEALSGDTIADRGAGPARLHS